MSESQAGLLIFDAPLAPDCLSRMKAISSRWMLFPLSPDDTVWRNAREALETAGLTIVDILSASRLLDRTAGSARSDYVDFISTMPQSRLPSGRTIASLFKCPSQNFSAWWFSLVAEKNPLRSDAYHNLVKLLTILDLCRSHKCPDIVFACSNHVLYEGLRALRKSHAFRLYAPGAKPRRLGVKTYLAAAGSALRSFASLFGKWWRIRRYLAETKAIPTSGDTPSTLAISYFPLLDAEALQRGQFVNRYFAPLQRAWGDREKREILWLGLPLEMDGYTGRQSLALGKKIVENGYRFQFQEEWLTAALILRVLVTYGAIAYRFLRNLRALRSAFQFGQSGLDIWPIFRAEWARSFAGPVLVNGLAHFYLFDACLKRIEPVRRLIYISENFAWEKALCLAARKRPVLKMGIQHTSVSIQTPSLFYFAHRQDKEESLLDVPMPDRLLCAGKIPADLHRTFGYPSERIVEWGAIRHQYVRNLLNCPVAWPQRGNLIVVAGSVLPSETEELLTWTWKAFAHEKDIRVVIKGHYACPLEPILLRLGLEMPPGFEIQNTPIGDLLPQARMLIVTTSTCAIEGIAAGCPVVVPKLLSVVDMSPLSGVTDLPIYVWNVEELRRRALEIVARPTSPLDKTRCRDFVEQYFRFVESDSDFLDQLMALKPVEEDPRFAGNRITGGPC